MGAVLFGLLVAALLSSGSLVGLAERQDFGTTRDIVLPVAEGFDRFSSFLSLDRPANALSSALDDDQADYDVDALIAIGRQQAGDAGALDPGVADAPGPTADAPRPTSDASGEVANPGPAADPAATDPSAPATNPAAAPGQPAAPVIPNPPTATVNPSATPVNPAATTVAPAQPQTSPFAPFRRQVSADNPLKLWVGGDSLTLALTRGFGRITPTTLVDYTRDPHISSGLTRPDYLDWPQRLARLLNEDRPEVLVIMFGGNDYQDVYYNGQLLTRPSQAWLDFYRIRVAAAMDLLNQPNLEVIWVGVPIMRDDFFATGMAHLNEIYRSEAASRSSIWYFDTWDLFADSNGNYTDIIDGQTMREVDGVHLTTAGGVRLAETIWETVAPRWGI